MIKKILFVLGGLGMGGVETYIVRLSQQLAKKAHHVEVLVLSGKADPQLMGELTDVARVHVIERFSFFSASSWLNGQLPMGFSIGPFDIVHVVDMLTLGFVRQNSGSIKFDCLSIGIYHSAELDWWRDRKVYFRDVHLSLYERNIEATLFPSESVVRIAREYFGVPSDRLKILPLGIDLGRYTRCSPSFRSNRIVSVGRLVNFKTYNKIVISQLGKLRQFRDFHYHVYGNGPESDALKTFAIDCGVSDFVHFEGEVPYGALPSIFSGCYCFVGSGTTIIEASAAGIPSIVGIESLDDALTSGFFSDVKGFSYNEAHASDIRLGYLEIFQYLNDLNEEAYLRVSTAHRAKAASFDIEVTADNFLQLSNIEPDFRIKVSSLRSILSFVFSLIRFGPGALKARFLQAKSGGSVRGA